MEPIQPLGIGRPGWLDRPSSISDPSQISGTGLPAATQVAPNIAGQTISALGINSSVSQLLSSIGGGVQNNKMLEMMIALLIIMSLLEQQRGGEGGSDALSKLGGIGSNMSSNSVSYSSTVVSTQNISMTYTQLQVNQVSGGHQAGATNQPQIDTTA